jgi:hypothetical protein
MRVALLIGNMGNMRAFMTQYPIAEIKKIDDFFLLGYKPND